MNFDYIVIGAGLSGAVIAERIATMLNRNVLIIEKRNHIGGNCYDEYDAHGVLIHKYGPHIFHTDNEKVWRYISSFTNWNRYIHAVLVNIDGKNVPLPFNFLTLRQCFDKDKADKLEKILSGTYGYDKKVPILELKNSQHPELRKLSDYILKKIYNNYSLKQWGTSFVNLDETVAERVPIFTGTNDCYFHDRYQGMPTQGYTELIHKILNNNNINILLNTDYKEIISFDIISREINLCGFKFNGILINTGKIDEFLDYKFGELPYRSINLQFETHQTEYYQEKSVVNYPNTFKFTRVVEFKHLTGQKIDRTTIAREYPEDHIKNHNDPYYPVPQRRNQELYGEYQNALKGSDNIIMLGRLGEYRYYDMDEAVLRALNVFEEIKTQCGMN